MFCESGPCPITATIVRVPTGLVAGLKSGHVGLPASCIGRLTLPCHQLVRQVHAVAAVGAGYLYAWVREGGAHIGEELILLPIVTMPGVAEAVGCLLQANFGAAG